jgi:hypothetical protein
LDGVALDRDTALTFQIHIVKQLGLHIALTYGVGKLQQSIGQGTFTVVNVRNNAEVAYILLHKILIKQSNNLMTKAKVLWNGEITQ